MSTLLQLTPDFHQQLARLAASLLARQAQVFTAESCTGGLLAAIFTTRPGASAWFGGGVIPYSNALKIKYLGVKERTLQVFGAVSEATVGEMALGLPRQALDVGVAISGIAGPDGGSAEKPVGMVCFGIAIGSQLWTFTEYFQGDRDAVRAASATFAVAQVLEKIAE
jgi:nicotinamide-nucleotide amidase